MIEGELSQKLLKKSCSNIISLKNNPQYIYCTGGEGLRLWSFG